MFEEIFGCSPIAMILVDENSEIQLVNKHVETLFQYSSSELIGKDVAILVPQELRRKHPSLVKEYFRSPLPRQMGVGRNLFGIKKDQTEFPIEVGLNPIQTDGKVFVMSSVIDITERARAEERFRAAVDAAPCGMIMIDQNGAITLLNKKTEEIFGYEKKELLNKQIDLLVPDDFKIPHPAFVRSYITKPEPRAMGIGRELFGKHRSGRLIPIEIGLQPVSFENEIFVISSIVDVTSRKEAEREIQSKSDEIKEFSYRTSHDLKSPLLSIGGLVDFIIEDTKEGNIEAISEGAHKIKSLTNKLNRLIDDILSLTKVDIDSEKKEYFDFQSYLVDAKEKFSHILGKNKIDIQNSLIHKKDLLVQKTRLTQVLDNLISNAAKYCDKNKEERFVKINTFNDTNKFYIQVEDNGLGIPKEMQAHVFSMFKRFHEGETEGSGLGLYMIKKHIQKLNAQIKFESEPSGTIFYLEFILSDK